MYEEFATLLLILLGVYAGLGCIFALAFVTAGVQKVDATAHGASVAFRLLIFPGVVAFWPVLARRWITGVSEPPLEQEPHR